MPTIPTPAHVARVAERHHQQCIQHYKEMAETVRALLITAAPGSPQERRLLDLSGKLIFANANPHIVCPSENPSCK
ncbi:hypothetical protein [Variovorax sp. J22R115]|uniref:hypothetical protein n=1 Tax=Variovorax sp. J22R115 TaxID=3053509 RepID=UPI0025781162|nr:hypothetical protein [Variovorax sp. J22R115]MDM0049294.1 hypothetical protein [Variovorax sp. J22R115]